LVFLPKECFLEFFFECFFECFLTERLFFEPFLEPFLDRRFFDPFFILATRRFLASLPKKGRREFLSSD